MSQHKNYSNITYQNQELTLEPRLREYIKKKKYYKDNNIEPQIPIEKHYMISDEDKRLIKDYFKNNSNNNNAVYSYENKNKYMDLVKPEKHKFNSYNIQDDPRFLNLKKKMERDQEAIKQRNNYDSFSFAQQKIYDIPTNYTDTTKVDTDDDENIGTIYKSDYIINNNNTNNNEMVYKDRKSNNNSNRKMINGKGNTDNKGVYSGKKEGLLDINCNKPMSVQDERNPNSYYGINGKKKSLGYPNPEEHYYNYTGTSMPPLLPFPRGGESVRGQNNEKSARPQYSRNIM